MEIHVVIGHVDYEGSDVLCAKVQRAIGWQEWLVEKNHRAMEAASDPAWWGR